MKTVFRYDKWLTIAGVLFVLIVVSGMIAAQVVSSGNREVPAGAEPAFDYDVVIVGGGASGVAAAIQAARLGAKTAVLEATDWLGGQMTTAGVATLDEGGLLPAGIYKEFLDRIERYYAELNPPKDLATCYFSTESTCFEPSIGRRVLEEMVADTVLKPLADGKRPVLDVHLLTEVTALIKDRRTVRGVVTTGGSRFNAAVVIDATEYGDLIPMTGGHYRVGNLTDRRLDALWYQSIRPAACVQSITHTAVLKKYPDGIPPHLRIESPPPAYGPKIKKLFGSLVKREEASGEMWSWSYHVGYRGLPNRDAAAPDADAASEAGRQRISKTSVNYANDYPWLKDYSPAYHYLDDPYPLNVNYLLDHDYRRQVNCEAKLRTLQFIYYVQNELDLPWAVAEDEGYSERFRSMQPVCDNIPDSRLDLKRVAAQLPLIPYVRESIRIVGGYTLSAKDIRRVGPEGESRGPFRAQKQFNLSAVALGDYAVDLHGCCQDRYLESYLGETRADIPPGWRYGPFQIPLETLIPKTVDGFVAAEKNISATRLASAAVRMQPTAMRVGQAAGALAALACRIGKPPRQVDPIAVQWALIKADVHLLIVENSPQTGFMAFADVPDTHPLWPQVQLLGLQRIMTGFRDGRFGVDAPLTRAQLAAALGHALKLQKGDTHRASFEDVAPDHPAFAYIETVHQKGLLAAADTDHRLFRPEGAVNRRQLAAAVVAALKLDTERPPRRKHIPQAIESMYRGEWVAAQGPRQDEAPVTRGEAAAVLTALLLDLHRIES